MGVSPENGLGAIRFSLGRSTTADEIDQVVARLKTAFAPDKPSLA
jgi:cysteine desulfurase